MSTSHYQLHRITQGQDVLALADRSQKPSAVVAKITPEAAKKWLERNVNNRKPKEGHINRLARDMREDKWVFTGEAIKFSRVNGQGDKAILLDGQNRLYAVIEADRPIDSLVLMGLDLEVQELMDAGKPRSATDVLTMEGVAYANKLPSMARVLYLYENATLGQRASRYQPTRSELLEISRNYAELLSSLAKHTRGEAQKFQSPTKIMGMVALFALLTDESEKYHSFLNKLLYGFEVTSVQDPVRLLREKLMEWKAKDGRPSMVKYYTYVVRAWNAHVEGRELTYLQYNPDHPFPDLVV